MRKPVAIDEMGVRLSYHLTYLVPAKALRMLFSVGDEEYISFLDSPCSDILNCIYFLSTLVTSCIPEYC